MATCQCFNAEVCYSSGLQYCATEASASVKSAVEDFLLDNDLAAHLEITRLLSIRGREKVTAFFADSYCSWQKEAIENANKLIKKFIPKKSNFDDFSDAKIMRIQKNLNAHPREKLNFDSPKNCFFMHFY